jgi:nitric-oxide synthase
VPTTPPAPSLGDAGPRAGARRGREVPADWSWIVPPMSGGITPVFHQYYEDRDLRPNFYLDGDARSLGRGECPMDSGHRS